jgi:hypothetical protein
LKLKGDTITVGYFRFPRLQTLEHLGALFDGFRPFPEDQVLGSPNAFDQVHHGVEDGVLQVEWFRADDVSTAHGLD